MGKLEIEAKIEFQRIIGEVHKGDYHPIRFSRIKYKASDQTHIDIRMFQRGYNEKDEEVYFPTKNGFQFLESEFNRVIKEYTLLPQTYIHRKIIEKSFGLLESGHFESAVLQAFKCIETRIREIIGADQDEVGVRLIRKAFNPENGILTNYELPMAEREGFVGYIAGAYAYYKNPCSHRDVELDFISTFDRIAVASDLLKIIDNSISKK